MNTNKVLKNSIAMSMLFFLFSSHAIFAQAQKAIERKVVLMGCIFQITIVEKDSVLAEKYIDQAIEEIQRIENLISEWQPNTTVSNINAMAGIQPVKVEKEVFDLTKRAIEYAKLTNGAFDISIAAMDKIWIFDGSMSEMPDSALIAQSIEKVDYRKIELDSLNSTIFLKEKGMKIGFGSIGKGYAADKTRQVMQEKGIKAGIINASGDIATWGKQPSGKGWLIGILNPFKKYKMAKVLEFETAAVATSGAYQKYAEIDDKRYGHIINPKTGMPSTGLTSVTIYGPSTEFANFLSTSIMVLGQKEGKKLIKKYPNYKYLFLTDNGKIIK